ncbi:Aste57867_3124 [Aphanomyces stellatus]|uniref:Aste57867_3124 protein n=1 Tax=Aphanomyces stellatus TaxID=120398 RepID=A0A485KET1_9STRA|nr:hypothetical protein As57867_003115 [Aphanomyces stellatus]VFT80300.1 Aste57867_3124 [Aphanomyces stellatus]
MSDSSTITSSSSSTWLAIVGIVAAVCVVAVLVMKVHQRRRTANPAAFSGDDVIYDTLGTPVMAYDDETKASVAPETPTHAMVATV